jgi:hypothetical protein
VAGDAAWRVQGATARLAYSSVLTGTRRASAHISS